MQLFYNIPAEYLINSTNNFKLKQITIKMILQKNDKHKDYIILFSIYFHNSIFLSYLPNEFNLISTYSNYMNTFIVEPTYYRRLTYFGRQCDPRVRPLFDDSLTDDCIMNCFQRRSIDAFNCIPFKKTLGFFSMEKRFN